MRGPRRLILAGAGHAHVEVLRRLAIAPLRDVETVLVSDRTHSVYSGMVPGYAAGQYQRAEIEVNVEALALRAGVRWIHGRVMGVDPHRRQVLVAGETALDYTVASLDVGASVAAMDRPGVTSHALPARPIGRLVDRLQASLPGPIAVVGAGAAGVELACCLQHRARQRGAPRVATHLIEAGPRILNDAGRSLRDAAERALRERDIAVSCDAPVARVDAEGVVLAEGRRVEAALVAWVTGAAPHASLEVSGLPLDAAGFIQVEPTLEVTGLAGLFAAGDCASLPGVPKAGVHAVRQGPILDTNLRARLRGTPLQPYAPQREFLRILNLGDGSAIASKWGITFRGPLAMRLKDRIDRAWLSRYQA